ncbi:MAG: STAS domain-containing protein [Myxococcota bacterium]
MTNRLTFEGDLDHQAVQTIVETIGAIDRGPLSVDLTEVDITDGRACAALADALRKAAGRIGDVAVIQAPQALAHTLYRVGALGSGTLQLIEPRDELGHAG